MVDWSVGFYHIHFFSAGQGELFNVDALISFMLDFFHQIMFNVAASVTPFRASSSFGVTSSTISHTAVHAPALIMSFYISFQSLSSERSGLERKDGGQGGASQEAQYPLCPFHAILTHSGVPFRGITCTYMWLANWLSEGKSFGHMVIRIKRDLPGLAEE